MTTYEHLADQALKSSDGMAADFVRGVLLVAVSERLAPTADVMPPTFVIERSDGERVRFYRDSPRRAQRACLRVVR